MKYCYSFVALFLILNLAQAQHTVLWRVQKPGSLKTSFLMGTYHIANESFTRKYPVLLEKMDSSSVFIMETEIDTAKVREYYERRQKTGFSSTLSKEQNEGLQKFFAQSHFDYRRLTPGEIYQFLASGGQKNNCETADTSAQLLDLYLAEVAHQKGLHAHYLESLEFQLNTMHEMGAAYSAKYVKKRLDWLLGQATAGKGTAAICGELDKYYDLDIAYSFTQTNERPAINLRNDMWMKQLPDLLSKQNCFIAVGLMHLEYKDGLIQQLREAGYIVSPINLINN